ncbi:hypothetical protein Tco_0145433 [Tanacetum coccineum]
MLHARTAARGIFFCEHMNHRTSLTPCYASWKTRTRVCASFAISQSVLIFHSLSRTPPPLPALVADVSQMVILVYPKCAVSHNVSESSEMSIRPINHVYLSMVLESGYELRLHGTRMLKPLVLLDRYQSRISSSLELFFRLSS